MKKYNQNYSVSFNNYLSNIIKENPSKLLSILFPNLSQPPQSRFHELFINLNQLNNQKIDENKESMQHNKKKNIMELNLYKIKNGIDKRTSLMIKNIPKELYEINVIKWLNKLANLNYIFVPKDELSNKILGFAFINVCNYIDILEVLKNLELFEYYISNSNKKIEVLYSHKQGLQSLINSFGLHAF